MSEDQTGTVVQAGTGGHPLDARQRTRVISGRGVPLAVLMAFLKSPARAAVQTSTAWSVEHGGELVGLVKIGDLTAALRRPELRVFIAALDGLLERRLRDRLLCLAELSAQLHRLDARMDEAPH